MAPRLPGRTEAAKRAQRETSATDEEMAEPLPPGGREIILVPLRHPFNAAGS